MAEIIDIREARQRAQIRRRRERLLGRYVADALAVFDSMDDEPPRPAA